MLLAVARTATRRVLFVPHARALANAAALVSVARQDKIVTLTMQRPPVNSLNMEMLTALADEIARAEQDKAVQGLILASGVPKVFSAGLDISFMYGASEPAFRAFWQSLQRVWLTLYGSRLATAAAIDGHAPAGGCLLSLACDVRIMRGGKTTIGLNETRLGIVAPPWFAANFSNVIGHRLAERHLMLGSMLSSSEAHAVGLVDALVAEDAPAGAVLQAASAALEPFVRVPALARQLSKSTTRASALALLGDAKRRQADEDAATRAVLHPAVQQGLALYLKSLAERKTK